MSINQTESYDLNSIFQMNINYNFDLLKTILDAILKKQKETSQSITDLHLIINEKDSQISNLEQNISNLSVQFQDKLEKKVIKREAVYQKEVKSPKSLDEEVENEPQMEEIKGVEDDLTLSIGVNNDELTNKLIKKINLIERKVNSLASVLTEVSKYNIPIQEHKTIFRNHKRIIDESKHINYNTHIIANNKMASLVKLYDEQEKKIQEIQIKTKDFNIMDIVQKENLVGSGDSSITFGLISNLERKILQKMKFVDERAAKQNEETIILRSNISNLTNAHDKAESTMNNIQESLKKDSSNIDLRVSQVEKDFNLIIDNAFEDMKKVINDKFNETSKVFDVKLNEQKKKILSNIPKYELKEDLASISSQMKDMNKTIKDLNKKVNDADKALKGIPITIESVWKEINATKENLNQKSSTYEHQELKDSISDVNKEMNNLKDKFQSLIEDQGKHDDILMIKRKLESMSNAIHTLKVAVQELIANASYNKMQIDTTKLLETQVFNEFKSTVIKENDIMNDNLHQLKRLIDELTSMLKTRCCFKDLKALEDELIEKMEELRGAYSKKFADKSETSKTLKYLEQQIKHIIDVYIKKMERGDSWLLAKKPMGGHSCGSCENYIGELKENPQFIPWNKYPVRDPNDKLYRIGNGFSKMIQMVTVDSPSNEKKDHNFQTSREFFNNSHNDVIDLRDYSAPKNKKLPRIMKSPKLNLSNDELLDNFSDGKETIEANHPKITKIVRKVKKENESPINQR